MLHCVLPCLNGRRIAQRCSWACVGPYVRLLHTCHHCRRLSFQHCSPDCTAQHLPPSHSSCMPLSTAQHMAVGRMDRKHRRRGMLKHMLPSKDLLCKQHMHKQHKQHMHQCKVSLCKGSLSRVSLCAIQLHGYPPSRVCCWGIVVGLQLEGHSSCCPLQTGQHGMLLRMPSRCAVCLCCQHHAHCPRTSWLHMGNIVDNKYTFPPDPFDHGSVVCGCMDPTWTYRPPAPVIQAAPIHRPYPNPAPWHPQHPPVSGVVPQGGRWACWACWRLPCSRAVMMQTRWYAWQLVLHA